jgi:hypothetical protein
MFGISLKRAATAWTVWLAVLGVIGLATAVMGRSTPGTPVSPRPVAAVHRVFDVRAFGATGDGTTNDAPAVNAAITAANAAGGGTVTFPAGTYLAGASIHMLSHVTLRLDADATLLGAATGYDPAEPNPYDAYQDYGHSHFHDAMIWGDLLTDIGFAGSGTIDGGGHFITGNPKSGQADKLISLTRCDGLTVSGITLKRGGHFAMLINGCDHVRSDHLTIATADNRDGWNVINTRNAVITNINVAANDDALVFKSDWALGATLPNGNVVVTNAQLSAKCCNALMFGSETCGNFTNYYFSHIVVTGAGKSGLGIVSMDGANISNVYYNDVVMSGTQSPIMEKIGTRLRCGGTPAVGSIRDIHYNNVRGTDAGAYSPTLWGRPGHQISDVTFNNVDLTLPGGHAAMDPNTVPSDNGDYNPNSLGTRPAYGLYIHNAKRIIFNRTALRLAADDARPAVIANAGSALTFHDLSVQRGGGSPFDTGFQSVAGYCVLRGRTVDGMALRYSTPGSKPSCGTRFDNFSIEASPAAQTVTAGSTATYTIHTAVASGRPAPIQLSASGQPAGAAVTFSPNPVVPGHDATMTVTTPETTRNNTYALTVRGSDATATQYAGAGLTVTGGVDVGVSGLSVADTDNAPDWSIQPDLEAGAAQYGDRTITLTSVPADLLGATWIRTANDSKTATQDPLATFTIGHAATVAVAIDSRLGRRPWMDAGWVDTGEHLGNSESASRSFEIFAKNFPAGQVTIGPNADPANGSSMYTIIIV